MTNFVLAPVPDYGAFFIAQIIAYLLAVVGLYKDLPGLFRKLTLIPAYLLVTNLAFMVAAIKFLKGETMATWQPRAGAQSPQRYNQAGLV